jgi:hypothetical protein
MLNPIPSLCGNAAPMRVHFFPVLPLFSYSSTVKTLEVGGCLGFSGGLDSGGVLIAIVHDLSESDH